MELNFGIFLLVSFHCILLNSHIGSCHRHLPPPAEAPIIPPTSSISEPPSSSPPSTIEAPAPSPTASCALNSSPVASEAPQPSTFAPNAPESSSATPESSTATPEAPKSSSGIPESSPISSTPPSTDDNGQSSGFGVGFGLGVGANGFNLDSLKGFGSMNVGSVKKFCETTENPTLCSNSILPFLKGSANMNWGSALEMEIDAFLSLSAKACATLKALLNNPSTSKSTAQSLQACLDIYEAAGDDLKQAKDALKTNDVGLLSSMLSGAITDLGTCDDSFKEAGEESPLDNNMVASMHKLVDNCFDISSAMQT